MSKHALLTTEDHRELRVRTGRGTELGDAVMCSIAVPGEFRRVQDEYPILFRLNDERDRFTTLNNAYVEKFGFPFIIAVRDHNKQSILENFEKRIANTAAEEFATACAQVERIALLRLQAILP